MEFRVWVIPLLLLSGAAWLVLGEVRHFRSDLGVANGSWTRLLRRLAGAAVVAAVAVMVHLGDTSSPAGLSPSQALERFYYWMAVLGLVVFAAMLALWDVVAELRRLRNYVDHLERDELVTLQRRLTERKS